MKGSFWRNTALTWVLLWFFAVAIIGQARTGFRAHNDELVRDGHAPIARMTDYLTSGHFISSVAENMESEFLQMALYVLLTAFLIQRGSSESKVPDDEKSRNEKARDRLEDAENRRQVRRRPLLWRIYRNSLSLALGALFLLFFGVHVWGHRRMLDLEQPEGAPWGWGDVLAQPDFWFESFQNWQSEFFSIAVIVVLSIFLRQQGSPQSKRLNDPLLKTGSA